MKTTSAGLILTDGFHFLGCHSTGNCFYDLPKGTIEENEEPIDACVREAFEETNLTVNKEELIELGVFSYNRYKNLHLFCLYTNELPNIKELTCNSFFYHPGKKQNCPEADGFKYIEFDNMKYFVTKNMYKVLSDIKEKIKSKEKQPH